MSINNIIHLQYGDNWDGYKPVADTPHHLLFFVEDGQCVYHIDGHRHHVRKGEVLFIAAHLVREAEPLRNSHSKYSIHWMGETMFAHFPQLENKAILFNSGALYAYLKQSYTKACRMWVEKEPYYRALCESILLEIIVRIHQEQASLYAQGKQALMVQQAKNYILEYYREPLSIDELALHVQRNASHFITSFKKHYSVTPIEYMHQIRIAKAEQLLLTSDSSIEALAEELGYCDAAYFSRMFKRFTGITISTYRQRIWK